MFYLQSNIYKKAYAEYCFDHKTIKEIAASYGKGERTVRRNFDRLSCQSRFEQGKSKYINLVFDGVYFGRDLCYMVCRADGRNIYYEECAETIENIAGMLLKLEAMGYVFKSFTVDGRKGVKDYLKWRYPNVPLQHCLFHQKAAVRRYLTGRPKTECGKALLELISRISVSDKYSFCLEYKALKTRYAGFLKERNERGQFMHKRLRSAFRSLAQNLPDLFTWQDFPDLKIPTTTGSCEGYFSQMKRKVRTHPGLKIFRLKKLVLRLLSGR